MISTKKPYTVTILTIENGVPVSRERYFDDVVVALRYRNAYRELGAGAELSVNPKETSNWLSYKKERIVPPFHAKKKSRCMLQNFIRQVYHKHNSFVFFVGYTDKTYEITVSGRKSKGAGVSFTLEGFAYYTFICKMAREACSWKEAKAIARNMAKIELEVKWLAMQLKHQDEWDDLLS